ncbi:HAD family phosphatase [Georgenia sp. 10Sc9-8]|uniref:HAD family phosphatase n=1 Tax=Georgenia halotolerans TaxID=3028317 RepID=A0ABT5TUQ8_9MICO|nr:HAD family phosphatase [Georgenia halotolerans]
MTDLLMPAAVLWDMDGTLVDTEPYWMAAEVAVVSARGGSWTAEQGLQLVGNALPTSARIILEQTGIPGDPEDLVTELLSAVVERVRSTGAPWRPGAIELLEQLRERSVPCALVTASYTPLAQAVVDAAPPGVFATVVTGDVVTNGKPHPEPYLTAAERLGVDPDRCVALEDSPAGVTSATAAGARTVAVPLMVPVPPRPGLSRLSTLDGVGPDLLARVANGEVIDEVPG